MVFLQVKVILEVVGLTLYVRGGIICGLGLNLKESDEARGDKQV